MKLSEAIRLGSMLRPQAFGGLFVANGSCALGAAEEAAGGRWMLLWLDHPSMFAPCPDCQRQIKGLGMDMPTIAHLNDSHSWTRERIADWVATIEPQDAPVEQPVAALTAIKK